MPVFSAEEIALRIGLATIAGMVLGFDREARGFPAGIRTTGLVSLSAAVTTVSALMLYADLVDDGSTTADPLRVIQGLAQAIGFIAAGLIFTAGREVHNLTSAVNLWLAAAVGIACGAAQFTLVLLAVGIGLFLLAIVRLFEKLVSPDRRKPEE